MEKISYCELGYLLFQIYKLSLEEDILWKLLCLHLFEVCPLHNFEQNNVFDTLNRELKDKIIQEQRRRIRGEKVDRTYEFLNAEEGWNGVLEFRSMSDHTDRELALMINDMEDHIKAKLKMAEELSILREFIKIYRVKNDEEKDSNKDRKEKCMDKLCHLLRGLSVMHKVDLDEEKLRVLLCLQFDDDCPIGKRTWKVWDGLDPEVQHKIYKHYERRLHEKSENKDSIKIKDEWDEDLLRELSKIVISDEINKSIKKLKSNANTLSRIKIAYENNMAERKRRKKMTRMLNKVKPIIFHIPHSSKFIPEKIRDTFVLSDAELKLELIRMTDSYTDELFSISHKAVKNIFFPASRLVVDPERFINDEDEPMSNVGMGVIYEKTSDLKKLRKTCSKKDKDYLISKYYITHQEKLANAVDEALRCFGKCMIIDCHSFPSNPLPYELDQSSDRPDICIGTDEFHTPKFLIDFVFNEFQSHNFKVELNRPYEGNFVPIKYYHSDPSILSIMIEINRRLYMNEFTGERLGEFPKIRAKIQNILYSVIDKVIKIL